MARTWPVTGKKQAMFAMFDALAGPMSSVFLRENHDGLQPVQKILVLELWHMGDVVLTTSVLQSLRSMYPEASITLLAKAHACEILASSDLVDQIVTFDFPWTATSDKYDPSRYDKIAIRELVRRLRNEQFDLCLDCRMDLRSNVLTRSIGAKRRIGYDFGGGGFLLTDALEAPAADQHKVDDWMALLEPLRSSAPGKIDEVPDPVLSVTDSERDDARKLLESYEIGAEDLVVGIHPGGSHAAKRWSVDNFSQVGRALAERHGAKLIVFVDPEGSGSDMQLGQNAAFVRTSIREMMALFTQCDLVVSNDSGPMHMAAALGTPVVAVFRTGNPKAYGPRGLNSVAVGSGAPWGSTSEVAVEDVIEAAEGTLAARSKA
ncbi:MAG TPA: glycosyltransferase family 9 protein [Gemmatimonadaceae bacterium]|nr:glycosyltransferase family 9 protein [Gemmatimonadaceae bacterium]